MYKIIHTIYYVQTKYQPHQRIDNDEQLRSVPFHS